MRSSPAGPTTPVRNSTDDRCPSPTARRLRTNRHRPGARPDWSGCTTADGLNRAAASTEYSWVNQAPDEAAALVGQLGVVGYPVGDPLVVAPAARPAGPGAGPV